jgi:aminopeptidase N
MPGAGGGQAGVWRFGPVRGTRPFDLTIAAGPYVEDWRGSGGSGSAVRMGVRRRGSLAGADGVAGLARFAEMARQSLDYYERTLGVPCPWPKYDIGFVPRLDALAVSFPGLMLVNESLLARMADPDDDHVAMVCAHEVSHLWFGGQVSARWWDDLWLDEAMATYVSCTAMEDAGLASPWTAFCYREKARAYQADALPGRQPVSSPVVSADEAMSRLPALTYSKGAAVIRQLAALIGGDALRAGLADFMRRFGGGTAGLDDLVACWSRSSGRDLGGWAQEWLRSEGASTLRASVAAGPDGTLAALAVEQDEPRTHRIGIGLYDRSDGVLRRRRVISAEISGGAVRGAGAGRRSGAGRTGAQRWRPDLRAGRVRPGHPGHAGGNGHGRGRRADRGDVLERDLADGHGGLAAGRGFRGPGDPAAGRLPGSAGGGGRGPA